MLTAMAKEKLASKPSIPIPADAVKITVDIPNMPNVVVNCEPGDLESYWARPAGMPFFCKPGLEYRFSVPEQVGYSPFAGWKLPRTDEDLGKNPTLKIVVTKRNERYVGRYNEKKLVDVILQGSTPKEEVRLVASVPDVNGRTEVMTPDTLTYVSGTKVTFSAAPGFDHAFSDTLYGQVLEQYNFLRWEEDTTMISQDTSVEVLVDHHKKLRALYGKTPRPVTPNDREVFVIRQQLFRTLDALSPTPGYAVIIDGKLIPIFGKLSFPTHKNAVNAVRTAIMQALPTWLARVPENWRDWLKVEPQREQFLDYWMKTAVQIIPIGQLTVSVDKKDTQNVDNNQNKTGEDASALTSSGSGGAANLQSKRQQVQKVPAGI